MSYCHVMSCHVMCCLNVFFFLTPPYLYVSAAKRKEARRRKSDGTAQETADISSLEAYCRLAVHDFAPHPVTRRQFMYWGAKVPEAAGLMLIRRS